ncbi:MAG: SDR family oxidoreductase [Paraprevotella sp.]|nr:SDR family oxidoreductase [Bacteroidaceae bacterium]MCI6373663.1 SDR family oxidoreductase [Paraprevotella sp.]MCI6743303.1 SDR family oxidoreductase [Paraprevotella sp.]MCI7142363.1 SDR family oxidoreductase [Paraprevotella sp.]MCI7748668.1 SDR family oxidoreductase [Paraprevotella sp.]
MSVFDIKDQVVVITGGTGVLGREIGTYLAHEGARVVLLGRRQDVGEALAEGIRAQGGDAAFYVCDVTDMEMVNGVRDQIVDRYGRVDALLNAAGGNMPGATIPPGKTLFDVQVEEFERVLNVNLTGTLIPTQAFLKPMTEAGHGSIVNFSSMAAFRPLTRVMGYAAAKAGISNLTAFLANEVATKFSPSIRVNAIAPGFFLTDQNRALLTNPDGTLTERGQDVIRQTPFKRFGKPEELCGTIQYLISQASTFVTGTVAVVDGGFNIFAI